MPYLSFDVESDYSELIRLQQEIAKTKTQIQNFRPGQGTSLDELNRKLAESTARYRQLAQAAIRSGAEMELGIKNSLSGIFTEINRVQDLLTSPMMAVGGLAGVYGLGEFLSKITKIRGEFQQMNASIETLVGKRKGEKLNAELQEFAKISPLEFAPTVQMAQQMLGFGIDAEKVPKFLQAIGDIAMGDTQKFQSLTLAFSQMSAAGKLMGQDLMQMVNAGFQPLQVISEKTGKSIGALKDEMSQGKISAEMVQEAFIAAASEGGKYYKMSETASKTIPGAISKLNDSMDLMFNDIGENMEGTLVGIIDAASTIVENIGNIIPVLATAAAAFGIYKTSVMLSTFAAKQSVIDASKDIIEGFESELAKVQEMQNAKLMEGYDDDIRKALEKGSIDQTYADAIQQGRLWQQEQQRIADNERRIAEEAQKTYETHLKDMQNLREQSGRGLDRDLNDAKTNGTISDDLAERLQNERDYAQAVVDTKEAALESANLQKAASDQLVESAKDRVESAKELMEMAEAAGDAEDKRAAAEEYMAAIEEQAAAITNQQTAQEAVNTAERERNSAVTAQQAVASQTATTARVGETTATNNNTGATNNNTSATNNNTSATNNNTGATNNNTAATNRGAVAAALATAKDKALTVGKYALTAATNACKNAWNSLKVAFMTNPIGMIITGLTTAIGLFMSFKDSSKEASAEVERFGESAVKTKANVDVLYAILASVSEGSMVYKDALKQLTQIAQDYGITLDKETDKYEKLIANREKLIQLIMEEGRQRQLANQIASYQTDVEDASKSFSDAMTEGIKKNSDGDAEEYADKFARIIQSTIESKKQEISGLIESYQKFHEEMSAYIGQNGWDSHAYEMENQLSEMQENIARSVNVEAKAFAEQLGVGKEYAVDIKKTVELTEKYLKDTEIAQKALEATIKQAEESKAKTEANTPKVEYSANGKDFNALIKDVQDAKAAIESADSSLKKLGDKKTKVTIDKSDADIAKESVDAATSSVETHTNTQGKTKIDATQATEAKANVDAATTSVDTHTATQGETKIDSSEATEAESNVDAATEAVVTHDSTEGQTHIDSTDADVARVKTEAATDELTRLDSVSADPEIKTTWIDNFLKKLGEAWDALLTFLGVEGDEKKTIAVPSVTPAKKKESEAERIKREREEAKKKKEAAISEIYKKAQSAKTDKEFAEAKKALNEYKSTLDRSSAEYKRAVKELEALEKRDKKTNGKKDKKGGSKDDPKQRAYELRKAQLDEEKRTAELLQAERNRQRELEIAQMEDNSEKEIATIKFTAEKKRQALEKELQKEADVLERNAMQQWLKGGKNRKEYQYYAQFSDAQLAEMRKQYQEQARDNIGYDTQLSVIANSEASELQKVYQTDVSAMRDYLKEYGTFQQKKLAIAEEYAEKIRKAQNKGEEMTLIAQRDAEIRDVEAKAMTSHIDWYSVFDNVGVILRGQLEPLYQKLQEYVKTDAFRKAAADNQQTVINAMENIRSQLGTNESWKDLSSALSEYQTALNELHVATENDARVSEELARLTEAKNTADQNLERARGNADTTPAQLRVYSDAVEAAQMAMDNYAATVAANNQTMQEAQNRVQSSGTMLSMSAKNVIKPVSQIYTFLNGAGLSQLAELWGAFDQLKGGIEGLKALKDAASASKELGEAAQSATEAVSETATKLPGLVGVLQEQMPELFDQLSQVGTGFNQQVQKGAIGVQKGMQDAGKALADVLPDELLEGLGKAGLIGQIIAAVLKILDILKDGIGTLISSILDSVFGAISGIIDNIFSGELFKQIGESLYKGILGIFKSIFTMGGLFDWWGNGESDKNLEKDIERLTATNEALRKAVDNLASEMREAATADMGALYNRQKADIEQSMKNTQEMMSRAGAAYSNGFLGVGGHKSSNNKINKGMSGDDWSRISQILGKSVKSASDFWNLTSEQMAKIAQSAPDLYAKIKSLADDGYKDASQYMDEYIEYYKELEELEKAFRESLTDVSFDSVKDDFKSLLLDMESDSKDFASNWEKMMQQAVINSLMNSKYNDLLKDWYKGFADAMNDDNGLTEEEQAKLKREWDDIVNSAIADRDGLKKAMGWDASAYSQEASKAGVTTITEDTGLGIIGRMTAMQEAVESIKANQTVSELTLADMTDELIQIAMEYSRFNVHQDNIERQLARIYIELQTISENTGAIVKPIQTMQADIAEIKKNTKNL